MSTATVNLYVNNEQAKSAIKELQKEYDELKTARKAAQTNNDTNKALELEAQERVALQKLRDARSGVLDVEKAMGNLTKVNLTQLNDIKRKLTNQLKSLNQDTDEYKAKLEQVLKVENQISDAKGKGSNDQGGWLSKAGGIGGMMKNLLPVAGMAGVITAVVAGVKGLVSDIWDLTQTIQGEAKRAAIVFGDQLGYVELQASKLSKKIGVTNNEFVAMTANVADLLVPLDFSREKASKMAIQVQQLSGALNEWSAGKIGVKGVSEILTKAILGETESLKQLGIGIRKDSEEYITLVKQKQAAGAASKAQAEAEAILELLYKKSADAQAGYAASGNELLRFQNSSQRGWRQMKESMAEFFALSKEERVEKMTRTYQALNSEFNTNEATLNKLLHVYDELQGKTNLNEEEQQLLRSAIDGIIQIVPHAATGFDNYGKALGVNTGIVSGFRESQRLLRVEMNKEVGEKLLKSFVSSLDEAKKVELEAFRIVGIRSKLQYSQKVSDEERTRRMNDLSVEIFKQEGLEKSQYNQAAKYVTMLEEIGYSREEIVALAKGELSYNYVNLDLINKITSSYNDQILAKANANKKDPEPKGLISQKQDELKKLREEKSKLTTEVAIADKQKEIEAAEAELKRLDGLGVSKANESNKSYSLDSDTQFAKEKLKIQERRLTGEFATEQEYGKVLLDLEIATLASRIAANKDSGTELLKLKGQLSEKQYAQTQNEKKRLESLQGIVDGGQSKKGKESARYTNQLKDLGLDIAKREQMTEQEKAALLVIEMQHVQNLSAIRAEQMATSATDAQAAHENELLILKENLVAQLSAVKAGSFDEKVIRGQYQKEVEASNKKHLEKQLKAFQDMQREISSTGILDGVKLTDGDIAKMQKIIDDLRAQLADLSVTPTNSETQSKKVDILGYSSDEWEGLFDNISNGKMSIDDMAMAAMAVGNAFSEVSKLMGSIEKRELKQFEKNQDKKKQALEKQLGDGVISQEQYSAAVSQIDRETAEKKEELDRKQAIRDKSLAIFQALVNTAVAITTVLAQGGIAGTVMAAIIGAMGAIQVATIAATPLPGAEDGGYLDVVREQDGRRFKAKPHDGDGYIPAGPKVLVNESGGEFVASADAVNNQTVKPMLDIIDHAQRTGSIRHLNLNTQTVAATRGYSSGGYTSPQPTAGGADSAPVAGIEGEDMRAAILQLQATNEKLISRLARPIKAYMPITGPDGFNRSMERYNASVKSSKLG